MIDKYTKLDKYFTEAKELKSPFSTEKARILVEKIDSNKSTSKPSFKNKGIISMASLTLLITSIIVLFNLTIFENDTNLTGTNGKSNINNTKSNDYMTNHSETQNTNNDSKHTTNMNSTNIKNDTTIHLISSAINSDSKNEYSTKIQGINTIQLTEAELIEFGIKYYTKNDGNEIYPGIGFWSPLGDKAAMNQVYYISKYKYSEHKQQELPLDSGEKFINLAPNIITNFKGMHFSGESLSAIDQIDINEFEPFYESLLSFISLSFDDEKMPKEIPNNIKNKLSELKDLFVVVKNKSDNYLKIAKKIDSKLKQLHSYFSSIASFQSEQYKEMYLTPKDSNLSSVMAVYLSKEPDSSDFAWKERMAKMGVKLVFAKHPLTMRKYLESNFQVLAKILIDYKEKYANYILVNKFVAMEVPFKNDKNNEGLFFWFYPSQTLISALPERFRESLSKEFKYLENEEAICGTKINAEKLYLDVWRACSGAIENLRIFPNPIQNEMHVRFELKEDREIQYELYDIHGNKIENLFVPRKYNAGSQTSLFDFGYLKSGMYLFAVRSNKGEFAVQRFIKE